MSPEQEQTIGLIGVGAMAMAMGERMAAAGHPILGFRRGALDEWIKLGGLAADSAGEVVAKSQTVLVLLPSDAALHEVLEKILPDLKSGQAIILLSTHPLAVKMAAKKKVERRGARFIEAEISGTPPMIRLGRASVFVSGLSHEDKRLAQLLEVAVGPVHHFASFGDATRAKLITNYLVSVNTMAAADALNMGAALGMNLDDLLTALNGSAAASTMLALRGPMLAQRTMGTGDLNGFCKCFPLIRAQLESAGRPPSELLSLTEALYDRTVEEGFGDCDLVAVATTLRGDLE